jgi:tetratricopeptide (TPR) repeat protein
MAALSTASEKAAEALRLVLAHPRQARSVATAALERAGDEGDAAAASMAERALGLAAKEFKDLTSATAHLRRAVQIAERSAVDGRAAEARMSLSLVLAYTGDTVAALREADLAAEVLTGGEAARLQMQRALILQRLGRSDEALDGYRSALAVFRRNGDREHEARLLNNRGLLYAYRGSLRAAERDLAHAEELHAAVGQELAAAEARHNLGFVAARAGDVPKALHLFDVADEYFRAHGVPRGIYLLDRAEVLLSVHLVDEARLAAQRAVTELARGGMAADLAEARLRLAEAAILGGDFDLARSEAERARRAFKRQQRPGWASLAGYARLRSAWLTGAQSAATLAAARKSAAELAATGWAVPALDARLIAARIALSLGRANDARQELVLASGARRRGPVGLRARAWHAEALLRERSGARRNAYSALRAGLRVIDQHRAALGATELRAHVSGQASELASLGLRLALEERDPARVLAWSERWRAGSLRLPPVRPPKDSALAADLETLRRVVGEVEQAAAAGRNTTELLRRQAELEERIRRRTRTVRGDVEGSLVSPPTCDALTEALGDRALIEFVLLEGQLHIVTLAHGRLRLHAGARVAEVGAELERLRFALRRLAHQRGSAESLAAAATSAAHAADHLDELLLGGLRHEVGDRPVVVVPTGALHAVPWAMLPTNARRPVSVSPSASLWHRSTVALAKRRNGRKRVVLVTGPGLPAAPREIEDVAVHYPTATRLVGEEASVERVREALDGVSLAHVAAHGTFRADNPLFSSLRLWDGPLTVYDLEQLREAPRTLVLSACESGLSRVHPGDELMGLASALLSLGAATLVGSVIPVPDEATRLLMREFHRELAAGLGPAAALAQAQATVVDERHETVAAAAAFVSLGAG